VCVMIIKSESSVFETIVRMKGILRNTSSGGGEMDESKCEESVPRKETSRRTETKSAVRYVS